MADSQEPGALDQFDLKLLAALEADGRLTNAELAEKVGLSASQCSRRRIRLEETGIIEGYSARLNASRLGILPLRAAKSASCSRPPGNQKPRAGDRVGIAGQKEQNGLGDLFRLHPA
jgi:DNA-binding Lrp family transcriptional regulator